MFANRTIISAMNPVRIEGGIGVSLKVWFAELNEPVEFAASPFDCERHDKELWIRAMADEYGPVEVRRSEEDNKP